MRNGKLLATMENPQKTSATEVETIQGNFFLGHYYQQHRMSLVQLIVKYFLEGTAVALAAYYLPKRKMSVGQIVALGVAMAAIFATVDVLAPKLSEPVRIGSGLTVGFFLLTK